NPVIHHSVVAMQVGAADATVRDVNLHLSRARRHRHAFARAYRAMAFVVRCFHILVTVSPKGTCLALRIDAHHHLWKYGPDYGWITDAMGVIKRDFLPADL